MKTIIRRKERKNQQLAEVLSKEVNLSPVVTEFLCDKGYTTKESILHFTQFTAPQLRKVSRMKDGRVFIEKLARAVKNERNIVIFADYDGDGVSSAAIFVWTLRWLGAKVNYFISNRFTEGYGISVKAMDRLVEQYPDTDLIVTCDNGVVAFDGIKCAQEKGIDVLVSDHHTASPDGRLPECPVVCETRLDEDQESREGFCGAELSRRLCMGLVYYLDKMVHLQPKMELLYTFSGFATITDVIDMNASNHFVAKKGIQLINSGVEALQFPCWKAFKDVMETREVTDVTIGYHYGPMINAAGRILGDASLSVDLFIEQDISKAKELVIKLQEINAVRQEKALEQQNMAKKEMKIKGLETEKFVIVSGMENEAEYEEGIAGLIAAFIVENYKKPAICLCKTENEGVYKGSARSVEGFNLKAALDDCSELLVGYGGHPMAAGLSIKKENIEILRRKLNELADHTSELQEIIEIDYLSKPEEMSVELAEQYKEVLMPFGRGLEKPVFATYGFFDPRYRILKEKHIKTNVLLNNQKVEMLWFNSMTQMEKIHPVNKKILVIGEPGVNSFNGRETLQIIADRVIVLDEEIY